LLLLRDSLAFGKEIAMSCKVLVDCGTSVVSVAGDIDWANSPELHKAINHALTGNRLSRLVVDLQGVAHMDSSGLGTLLDGLQESKHQRVRFILCGLEKSLRRVLERTRLNTVFEIRPTRQEALQPLATSG
jgi:anti-anti-sigma factor